jgi:hypothetical protein
MSTLSHKEHDFRKTLFNTKCVLRLPLQLLSKVFLILGIIQRDNIIVAFRNFSKGPASYTPAYKRACPILPHEERLSRKTLNS